MVGTAVSGGITAYGSYKEGAATNKYYKSVANTQEEQGRVEFARGEKQSELGQDAAKFQGKQQKTEAAQLESAQRATMVANGIDLSSVTSQDLTSETISKSRLDEMAIRYNADISSWNTMQDAKYKRWAANVNAANSRAMGSSALASAKNKMGMTLLTTAVSMAGAGVGGMSNAGWFGSNAAQSSSVGNASRMTAIG